MNILITVSVLGIVTMMSDVFGYKKYIWLIIIATLSSMFAINLLDWNRPMHYYHEMIFVDNYAVVFSALLIFLTLIWFFVSNNMKNDNEFNLSDHYAQIIFSLTGALILTSYSNLSMLFLGIEIMSIPLYILAGSRKKDLASNESSLKYFMMGAFTTGFLLFGITLIYGVVGSFNLGLIQHYTSQVTISETPIILFAGIVLIFIGLGFKVAMFPMHFWTPDVYEGAPVLVTGFMATIVKSAAFAGFFRLFQMSLSNISSHLNTSLILIIAFTILVGNITAVYQTNFKRLMAYSGIAQSGYMLMFFLIPSTASANALLLYLASYSTSTLCIFGILYWIIKYKGNTEISSFKGLSKENPLLSLVLTVSLISLAGIPPTVGFFAKFNLFKILIENGYLGIVIVSVIGSLISVYYYFKAIIQMYSTSSVEEVNNPININNIYKVVFLFISIILIVFGVVPDSLLGLISQY